MASSDFLSSGSCLKNLLNLVVKFPKTFKGSFHSVIFLIFYNSQPYCSRSKFASKLLNFLVKSFPQIFPDLGAKNRGFHSPVLTFILESTE